MNSLARLMVIVVLVTLTAIALWPNGTAGNAAGVQISAGGNHTCALTAATVVKCWGSNGSRQLGNGDLAGSAVPVDVLAEEGGPPLTGLAEVASGGTHTCARTVVGGAVCWGSEAFGERGCITCPLTASTVTGLGNGVAAIAAGIRHTCAVTTQGGVKCFGSNEAGQLGTGTTTTGPNPTPMDVLTAIGGPPLAGIDAIAAGGNSVVTGHTCALTNGGGLKCWGRNDGGQLGDATTVNRSVAVDVVGLAAPAADVAAGAAHTCAVTQAGNLLCWGANNVNQLGVATTDTCVIIVPNVPCSKSPLEVNFGSGVVAVAAGEFHTCALTDTGGVKCWGLNSSGQVGDGTRTDRAVPVEVQGLTEGVLAITAGLDHSCALTSTNGVKCWGSYDPETTVSRPTAIMGFGDDNDEDGLLNSLDPDDDNDGCTDIGEQGSNPQLGGLRNPKNFWDFFDVPAGAALQRDRVVTVGDIFAIVRRFGATGDLTVDPLSPPGPPPAYHTAHDRSSPLPNDYPWALHPPDGTISTNDILFAVNQFGHSCL